MGRINVHFEKGGKCSMKTNVYLYYLATKKTLYNTKLDKNVLLKVYTGRAKKKDHSFTATFFILQLFQLLLLLLSLAISS